MKTLARFSHMALGLLLAAPPAAAQVTFADVADGFEPAAAMTSAVPAVTDRHEDHEDTDRREYRDEPVPSALKAGDTCQFCETRENEWLGNGWLCDHEESWCHQWQTEGGVSESKYNNSHEEAGEPYW